jgi:translation initiation factor IF-2
MDKKNLHTRPPIVVVLGHVDHGKSTLLDFIRKTNTVAREAGGITQHVAAYEVEHEYEGETKKITFIDTPGHAAFQAIRSRGASVADIAILVVAADDGVKAQTLEALKAIRDQGLPYVVAINKIDKPNADLNRTQMTLLENEVFLEKLGGDVPWAAVSAKVGTGVSELLDLILLVAQLHEPRADSSAPASGFVIESHLDHKRGIASTLIIRNGTLEQGMAVVAGQALSPVRIMENYVGKTLKKATASTPVLLVGFDSLPEAGAEFVSFKSKKDAELERSKHAETARAKIAIPMVQVEEEKFLLPLVIRADALGSMEAIQSEAAKIGDEGRGISIVQWGIGDISENDIKAAIAAGSSVVIGFNVRMDAMADSLARQHGVHFENFSIIYELTRRLEELLKERAPRRVKEEVIGRAKILKYFSSRKDEHLIGASVISGMIKESEPSRLMRRNDKISDCEILSMQSARKSVTQIGEGAEFGAQIVCNETPKEGDVIESVLEQEY